jgi:hypothetical protein
MPFGVLEGKLDALPVVALAVYGIWIGNCIY